MFSMKSIKKRILGFSNSEKGFTLIEIIAVLVILGILAAVAIPKFTNLQEEARIKAASAAVAEAKARASQAFANLLLESNGTPPLAGAVITAMNTDYGSDFTVSVTQVGDDINIDVLTIQGTAIDAGGEWPMP